MVFPRLETSRHVGSDCSYPGKSCWWLRKGRWGVCVCVCVCVAGGGGGEREREGDGESDSGDSLRMRLSQFIEELGISCERKKWDRTSRLLS